MKYQLVLQWPCDPGAADYDSLVDIEDVLAERLPSGCEVDGHDIGSHEMNIFILTDTPLDCFEKIKEALGERKAWMSIRVAYRALSENKYTILWPSYLTEFAVA